MPELVAGDGVSLTPSGSNLIVAATGSGGGSTTAVYRFGKATDPVTGSALSANTFVIHDPLPRSGTITQIKLFGGPTFPANFLFRRFTKSGTVFTQIGSDAPSVASAVGVLNTYTTSIVVNAGEYLGFYMDDAGLAYASATGDNGGFYYHAGNQTSVDTSSGATSFSTTLQLQLAFDITYTASTSLSTSVTVRTSVDSLVGSTVPDQCEISLDGWTGRPLTGESTACGTSSGPALSVTQPYSNLTFAGGVKSDTGSDITSTIALIEDNKGEDAVVTGGFGETPISSAANHAVRLGAIERGVRPSRFTIFGFTAGHGGSKVADISKGTTYYTRLMTQVAAAKTLASAATKILLIPAIDLIIGINDAAAGTAYATVLSQLQALQSDMEGDVQTALTQASPIHMLISQQSQYNNIATDTTRAQAAACHLSRRIHMVCPQYFLARVDGTHFTNLSTIRLGHYFGRAFNALINGLPTPALTAVSAVADGTALTIHFAVPVAPIVLDTTTLGAATDKGIKVVDGTGTLTLSSIVAGADGKSITATLNRTLGTSPKCRIGLDFAAATVTATSGTATNIRDSSADTHVTSGTTYQMYNWAVADELDVIKLAEAV
jgi:hypothetical protein